MINVDSPGLCEKTQVELIMLLNGFTFNGHKTFLYAPQVMLNKNSIDSVFPKYPSSFYGDAQNTYDMIIDDDFEIDEFNKDDYIIIDNNDFYEDEDYLITP